MNYVYKGSKINRNIRIISIKSVKGRSLIRTFMAGATNDAAICLVSGEQAQKKKMRIDLVLTKRMFTFETMSRSYSRSKILK